MSKSASNVVTLPTKGDAELADTRHAAERAELLRNLDTAEDLLVSGLVCAISMTVTLGRTSPAEVAENYTRCGSPKVYASQFNLGARAQEVIGQKAALELIAKAERGTGAKGSGSAFPRVVAALRAVCDVAKSSGKKELTPREAKAATTEALAKAAAPKVKVVRAPQKQDTATMAAAALQCGKGHKEMAAFILLASNAAHRLPAPEGRESAHREALALLSRTAEAWSVFK